MPLNVQVLTTGQCSGTAAYEELNVLTLHRDWYSVVKLPLIRFVLAHLKSVNVFLFNASCFS